MEIRLGNISFSIGKRRETKHDDIVSTFRKSLSYTGSGININRYKFNNYRRTASIIVNGYLKNTVVSGCVTQYQKSYPEPTQLIKQDGEVAEHTLLQRLLKRPNPWMSESRLDNFKVTYQLWDGNCFLVKGRNSGGVVTELFPFSGMNVRPVATSDNFIDHYEFMTFEGKKSHLKASEVIHLPWFSFDPAEPWMGISPARLSQQEWQTDNEITEFLAAFMKNYAVPPLVLEAPGLPPEAVKVLVTMGMTDKTVKQAMDRWQESHSGMAAGKAGFVQPPFTAKLLGSGLKDLDIKAIIAKPEVRTCLSFLIPPEVLGVNAGLEESTYANKETARKAWTFETLIPLWVMNADNLTHGLREDFGDEITVEYNIDGVRSVREQLKAQVQTNGDLLAKLQDNYYNKNFPREAVIADAMYLFDFTEDQAGEFFPEKKELAPTVVDPSGKLNRVNGNKVGV